MQAINKAINKVVTWCIILTALLPIGLFMVIFGAINSIWAMLGVGIFFTVVGFYGTPLIWVKYGDARSYKRIVSAVVVERIFSIEQIATHLNIKCKVALEKFDTCIRREFLIGYIREGDIIRPNQNMNANTASCKCSACGARFEYDISTKPKCPYCNTIM